MVCGDRRVRRRFGRRVYLVTVGRDVRGPAAVAAKVNDVIKLMTGSDAPFPDPQPAGQQLGALLDAGPPRLLVLDDVWERDDEMDELHASLIAELASGRMALPVTMEMTVLGAATSAWATTP